jgi:lysophospholipase L1-like esterase
MRRQARVHLAPVAQAVVLLDATAVENALEPADRCFEGQEWAACNLALGSSSWGNTNAAGGIAVYPQRFDLAFNQRFRTLNLNTPENVVLHVWLGTNDLAYDLTLSAADVWARAETSIGLLRTEFPDIPIIMGTHIRRGEVSALNTRIGDYNTLLRANYLSIGADDYVDYETCNADFNTSTGNSASANYAGDGVHPSTVGAGFLATALSTKLLTVTF